MKVDLERFKKFTEKHNGMAFDAFEPAVRATGIPVPVEAPQGAFGIDPDTQKLIDVEPGTAICADLYTLDAASLLEWIRKDSKNAEKTIFMLLGWDGAAYLKVADPELYDKYTK